jgi:hypothetical protein
MQEHEHEPVRTLDPARFLRTLCVAGGLSVVGAAWSAARERTSDLVGLASLILGLAALFAAPVAARMAWRDAPRKGPLVGLAAAAMAAGAAVAALFAFSHLPR